jgi:ElaB/YqjD/DUF883 family membrane-anchored ribosome-binding protein
VATANLAFFFAELGRAAMTKEVTMSTRSDKLAAEEEIAAIEKLVTDLEKRLRRITGNAPQSRSATGDVGDFVAEALTRVRGTASSFAESARDTATGVSQSVTDEVARIGSDALKKVSDEIEHQPLLMVAIAAGIGFLLGRRSKVDG